MPGTNEQGGNAKPGWEARLSLKLRHQDGRTLTHHEHEGPLRVLQALYPEGPAICHHVLVHPPGGLTGGDQLHIDVQVQTQAHALITTPGATRFYRSAAGAATQRVEVHLQDQARLEWLPLETIAYSGCLAQNQMVVDLAPTAEFMAWDILALGLPASDLPFVAGHYQQHFEVRGVWMDRGLIDASDTRLLNGPLGLAGKRCLGTLVMASGMPMKAERAEQALELARSVSTSTGSTWLGVTQPQPQILVARVLCEQTEPARQCLQAIWSCWREAFWGLQPQPSRMWQV
jgi:urease accessory protein